MIGDKNKDIPESYGEVDSAPFYYPRLDELCSRLDSLYKSSRLKTNIKASDRLRGAISLMRESIREINPDWMAQVAHSLREIIYVFDQNKFKWKNKFQDYGSSYRETELGNTVGNAYGLVSNIAHHNFDKASTNDLLGSSGGKPVTITNEIFEKFVIDFGDILFSALRRQIDAHKEIDELINSPLEKVKKDSVDDLVGFNTDSREYFYAQADESWLPWLWKNGFLDIVKIPADDTTRYGYRTPEIKYLVNVAEKDPDFVVDQIILNDGTATRKDKFRPELIDQFLKICGELDADNVKKVVPKIHREQWVTLMSKFNSWGFSYKKMLETLSNAKSYKEVLLLSDIILSVKTKEEYEEQNKGRETAFYLGDLSYTDVFETLSQIEKDHLEQAFALLTDKIVQVVKLGDRIEDERIYTYNDEFSLYSTNFFSATLENAPHYQRDVAKLFITAKEVGEKLINSHKNQQNELKRIYKEHLSRLLISPTSIRLLFCLLSKAPEAYKDEVKNLFEDLFVSEKYSAILYGAEFQLALKESFQYLEEEYQRDFIKKVITYFTTLKEEEEGDRKYHLTYGTRILSCISKNLTAEEKETAIQSKFELNPNYKPQSSIVIGGPAEEVIPQSPDDGENIQLAEDFIEKIKKDWTPKALYTKYGSIEDFARPKDADGVAQLLKDRIRNSFLDYVENAAGFFNVREIDPHYTYSYLRGVIENISEETTSESADFEKLLDLFERIVKTDKNEFEEKDEDKQSRRWLARWDSVLLETANLLESLLKTRNETTLIDFKKNRGLILEIISNLLNYPDPTPEEENPETSKTKVSSPNYTEPKVSDPFQMAINSVKGNAFEAFIAFVHQDAKGFDKQNKTKLNDDVKDLYESILKTEKTKAIRFMIGRFIPAFYYRDRDWFMGIFSQVFPDGKASLYQATWEGYLSNNLFEEIFFEKEFQKLYRYAIEGKIDPEEFREYFVELDEGVATHLALAIIYFKEFDLEHDLLKDFFAKANVDQKSKFVSFIGRHFISGDVKKANEHLKEKVWAKDRLTSLWEKIIYEQNEPKIFEEFGTWIDLEKELFEKEWLIDRVIETLKKSNGFLDWELEISKVIETFATNFPEKTLEICKKYLTSIAKSKDNLFLYEKENWVEAVKTLYQSLELQPKVESLVSDLILKGGREYWDFEKAINDKKHTTI